MALLLCPDCGKKYSSSLDACPECHSPAAGASEVPSSPDSAAGRRELRDFDLSGATRKGWIEGMVFKNKYELVKRLGRGAQTEAWKAKDLEASDDERAVHVVLKLLPQDISGSHVELLRIRKNFQKVHDLVHQRIASYRAFEQDGDDCMVVMELAPGVTLGEYRLEYEEKHGEFPVPEAVRICRQIAEGLDYAHSRQVAHRDIKPDNIMVTPEGDVKILDFGLAAEIRSSMSRVSNRQLYDSSGTNLYKAPEQWRGLPPQYGTDQYALAVVFHELLSGSPPFVSDDPGILGNCALNNPPQPLPMLSEAQNRALLKALAKDPEERFETCMAFIDAVAAEEPKAVEPVVPVPPPPPEPIRDPVPVLKRIVKKIRISRGKVAATVILILLACCGYWAYSQSPAVLKAAAERQARDRKMQAWVNEQPIKLGEKVGKDDFKVDDQWWIYRGSSLLSFAALQGRVDVLEWLKENGEDATAKEQLFGTALFDAAFGGHVAAMEWLKENGVEVNAERSVWGCSTPMMAAASGGHIAAMEWLKANGAELNGDGVSSPMHLAAMRGDISTMEWLKENGADVNDKHGLDQTPLDYARRWSKADAEKWLTENGGKSGKEL